MSGAASGQQPAPAQQTPAPSTETHATPAEPETVTLTKAEHDALQANLRRANKRADTLEQQQEQRESEAREAKARAENDYEAAKREADARAEAAEKRAKQATARTAVQLHALRVLGDPEQAAALVDLAAIDAVQFGDDGQPTADSLELVVGGVKQRYPKLFGEAKPAASSESAEPETPAPGPAVPASKPPAVDGYISMQEYAALPQHERLTPEVQKRVDKSRPYWHRTAVPAGAFREGSGGA